MNTYALYSFLAVMACVGVGSGLYVVHSKQRASQQAFSHIQAKIELIEAKEASIAPMIQKVITSQEPWRDLQSSSRTLLYRYFPRLRKSIF